MLRPGEPRAIPCDVLEIIAVHVEAVLDLLALRAANAACLRAVREVLVLEHNCGDPTKSLRLQDRLSLVVPRAFR